MRKGFACGIVGDIMDAGLRVWRGYFQTGMGLWRLSIEGGERGRGFDFSLP